MLALLNSYILVFLNPVSIYEKQKENQVRPFSLWEGILLSWVVVLLHTLVAYILGEMFFQWSFLSKQLLSSFVNLSWIKAITFFFLILSLLLFPLVRYLKSQIWIFLIRALGKSPLELQPAEYDLRVKNIVTNSLSAYLFNLLPLGGEVLRFIYAFILLYVGLRKNLQMSRSRSLFILSVPYLVLFFLCIFPFFIFFVLMR
ncbi:MAG: hypothetical protein KBD63_04615 [Bacteriovoracaceae bacterium]|nr:hypothetical protein [Bacteriovoracaceae bacterium]